VNLKGAIFDVDGTLLDSMSLWDTIGEEYLRAQGIEPRENLKQALRSMSLHQAACYYQREYGLMLATAQIMDGVNAMIGRYYREEVLLKEGAAEFLEKLSRSGVKMCIATATERRLAEAALERLNVRHYFSEIFTCASVGCGKDRPVIFETALAFLATPKPHTVVFEDALHAVETAKASGFRVVAVRDRYETQPDRVRALADVYLHDFYQAEEALLQ